jgi:hypothetical protein
VDPTGDAMGCGDPHPIALLLDQGDFVAIRNLYDKFSKERRRFTQLPVPYLHCHILHGKTLYR